MPWLLRCSEGLPTSKMMRTIIMVVIIALMQMIVIGNTNERPKYSIWYWTLKKYSLCNWCQKQIQVNIDKVYLLFTASVCGSLRKNNLAATICTIITIIVLISDGLKRNKKFGSLNPKQNRGGSKLYYLYHMIHCLKEWKCGRYSSLKRKIIDVLILFAYKIFLIFPVNLQSEWFCIILHY